MTTSTTTTTTPALTLDQLLAKLPASLKPWAQTYGPALLAGGSQLASDFINLILKGDQTGAYRIVLAAMPDAAFQAEGLAITNEMAALNQQNADSIALQKKALTALLSVLLTIVLAMVGL